jgi:hypothetical protein
MEARIIYHGLVAALLMGAAIAVTGCAKPGYQDGPYAESKQSWDPPRSDQQLSQLRNRLATTQRDN